MNVRRVIAYGCLVGICAFGMILSVYLGLRLLVLGRESAMSDLLWTLFLSAILALGVAFTVTMARISRSR